MQNVLSFLMKFLSRITIPVLGITDILEIILISYFVYQFIVWIKFTRAYSLLKGILVIAAFIVVAYILRMNTILWLFRNLASVLIIGLIVMAFVIKPPSAIVWINLFAMGGLECAFFCPILFGLYWKKANALGSVMSSILGVAAFLFISSWNTGHPEAVISLFGTSPIVPSILISIAAFVIFSLIGKKPDQETLDLFYPEQA